MPGITQAQAQAKLDEWLAADTAVAKGQSYQIFGSRTLTRADAAEIRENIKFWDAKVRELDAGSGRQAIRVRGATPISN